MQSVSDHPVLEVELTNFEFKTIESPESMFERDAAVAKLESAYCLAHGEPGKSFLVRRDCKKALVAAEAELPSSSPKLSVSQKIFCAVVVASVVTASLFPGQVLYFVALLLNGLMGRDANLFC